ncbi:MAG: TIM barrel protein [Balneolaceae bacterium]
MAQYSLHRALYSGELTTLDFPAKAKNDFGIDAVEYVNQFFADKAEDFDYLAQLKNRTEELGVQNLLIMVDGEGLLSSPNKKERSEAVKNHQKWVDAAKFLGCHSIRVNLNGASSKEEWIAASVDGLGKLVEYGADNSIHIIVENHGGLSSNASFLTEVLNQIGSEYAGTLPDFGNFCIRRDSEKLYERECVEEYDKYLGVKEMMPFAQGVSAKSYDFNERGNETTIDFLKMLTIIKDAGFSGYIGIEYEGNRLSEDEGIRATKKLLEKIRNELK